METYQGENVAYWLYAEEGKDDVVTEALYARQSQIMDYLGVEFIAKPAVGDNTNYTDAFITSVKNKDGSIDLFAPHAYVRTAMLV